MSKKDLRKYYSQKRLSLTDSERSKMDDLLLIRFQQWQIPDQVHSVLSYWPLAERGEPNTFLITDFMEFRMPGIQLAYPISDFTNHSMEAVVVNDKTDYRRNEYGIAEPIDGPVFSPAELDLIIVPLLAFDHRGYRIGYGKGFYDRYLSQCRPDAIKLGICYFGPIADIPGIDQYDIPLDICITPEAIYEF